MNKYLRLKVYTKDKGLITSKAFEGEAQLEELLYEALTYLSVTAIYVSTRKGSKEILTPSKQFPTRPNYYRRSDGVMTYTMSVHPENYPMTAYYADGREVKIELL